MVGIFNTTCKDSFGILVQQLENAVYLSTGIIAEQFEQPLFLCHFIKELGNEA